LANTEQTTANQQGGREYAHWKREETRWERQHWVEVSALFLSVIAVAITGGVFCYTTFTYQEATRATAEARRQADAAERNLSNTQRPFVVVRGVKMIQFISNLGNEPSWFIYPDVTNMGNSSTRNMLVSSAFGERKATRDPDAWQAPSDKAIADMMLSVRPYDLGPQQSLPSYGMSMTFNVKGLDDCQEFFFFGQLVYGDKFTEDRHVTKFCFIVGGPGEGGGDGNSPLTAPCSDYNCADDGCWSDDTQRAQARSFGGFRMPVKASKQSFSVGINTRTRQTTLQELRYDSPFEPGYGRCSNPPPIAPK
jgi:hypothetical protein